MAVKILGREHIAQITSEISGEDALTIEANLNTGKLNIRIHPEEGASANIWLDTEALIELRDELSRIIDSI